MFWETDTVDSAGPAVPEGLLPTQFYDLLRRPSEASPEHRLLAAVLEQAVVDFQSNTWMSQGGQRPGTTAKPRKKSARQDAEEWFANTEDCGPFSFESICAYFDINSQQFRKGLQGAKSLKIYRRRFGRAGIQRNKKIGGRRDN